MMIQGRKNDVEYHYPVLCNLKWIIYYRVQEECVLKGEASPSIYADWMNGKLF